MKRSWPPHALRWRGRSSESRIAISPRRGCGMTELSILATRERFSGFRYRPPTIGRWRGRWSGESPGINISRLGEMKLDCGFRSGHPGMRGAVVNGLIDRAPMQHYDVSTQPNDG